MRSAKASDIRMALPRTACILTAPSFSTPGFPTIWGTACLQMADVASIMRVLGGSSWESEDPDQQNLYDWVETAFEPFLYHGYTMPMVSGREVSRNDCIENGGFTFTKTLLMLLEFAPEEYLDDYQSMIKSNLEAYEKDGKLLEFYKALPLYYIPACSRIFEDSSIEPWEIKTEAKVYGNMDRALQRNPDYSVGIAMHSKRTKIFESNDEWVNGFHTANGDGISDNQRRPAAVRRRLLLYGRSL